jgi:hypothetical protein
VDLRVWTVRHLDTDSVAAARCGVIRRSLAKISSTQQHQLLTFYYILSLDNESIHSVEDERSGKGSVQVGGADSKDLG